MSKVSHRARAVGTRDWRADRARRSAPAAPACTSATAPTMRATRPRRWCSACAAHCRTHARPEAYARRRGRAQLARIERCSRGASRSACRWSYLTHGAGLRDCRMYVDQRVLIPRSPIAELIERRFAPWIDRAGCAASSTSAPARAASRSPARVPCRARGSMPVDISPTRSRWPPSTSAAIDSAGACGRCDPTISARCAGERYDIIVSNPPYVGRARDAALPPEYRHEPPLGAGRGADGMDSVRAILAERAAHLNPGGCSSWKSAILRIPRCGVHFPGCRSRGWTSRRGGGGVFVPQGAGNLPRRGK